MTRAFITFVVFLFAGYLVWTEYNTQSEEKSELVEAKKIEQQSQENRRQINKYFGVGHDNR